MKQLLIVQINAIFVSRFSNQLFCSYFGAISKISYQSIY